ncbi:MAG: hypothetical protein WA081_08375 [Desulfosalsimonadaceae bacterium]
MNKPRCALVCLFMVLACHAPCSGELIKGLDFHSRWPDASQRAAAVDPDRNLLFLGDGNILTVLTMDTLTPVSRLELDADYGVRGVVINENTHDHLYLACGKNGVRIIDVTDAAHPLETAALTQGAAVDADVTAADDPIFGSGIACLGDRVFVADLYFGLRVINVSDPAAPFQEAAYEQTSVNSDGEIFSGGYENLAVAEINGRVCAFVLDKYYGMRVFEIGTNSVSHAADYPPTPDTSALYDTKPVTDVAVYGNGHVIISDYENGLLVLNLFSDPAAPDEFHMAPVSYFETPGAASGMSLSGNRVYVADGNSGLLIVDITDLTKPAAAGTFAASGAHSVTALGTIAFVSDAEAGLRRIDAANPSALAVTHRFDSPSDADGVFVDGDLAYTVDNDGPDEGLRIIRLSDTGDNRLVGFCKTPGNAGRVQVKGDFAYIADGPAGLTVIDVTDPAAPARITTASGSPAVQNAVDIHIPADGDIAYLADASGQVIVFDLTTPSQPVQTVSPETGETILALSGFHSADTHYLYTAGSLGLTAVDVSDPLASMVLDTLDTPGDARDVFVLKNYAYVADGAAGLTLVSLSRPDRPDIFGTYALEGDCQAVFADNVYAHCAKGESGVEVIGISDEKKPRFTFVTRTDTPGYAGDIFVAPNDAGRFTFVADGSGGLLVFKHNDQYSGGIDEQPFTGSTHDRGWDRISCFISTLLD